MSLRDKISHFKHEHVFAKTLTAAEESVGVDLQGYASATVLCSIGAMTNVGGTESWTFALEESDDNSVFTDVAEDAMLLEYGNNDGSADGGVFATVDAADKDDANYSVGYSGSSRYIRVVATAANTPGSTAIAVNVIKEALQKPVIG